MMSDVLAYAKNKAVLLTGLLNIQVVRTADVSDIAAIIFVRDKHPGKRCSHGRQEKGYPRSLHEVHHVRSLWPSLQSGTARLHREGCGESLTWKRNILL